MSVVYKKSWLHFISKIPYTLSNDPKCTRKLITPVCNSNIDILLTIPCSLYKTMYQYLVMTTYILYVFIIGHNLLGFTSSNSIPYAPISWNDASWFFVNYSIISPLQSDIFYLLVKFNNVSEYIAEFILKLHHQDLWKGLHTCLQSTDVAKEWSLPFFCVARLCSPT